MVYEIRENSGSLFKNEKKETDAHPTLTGTLNVGGTEYWISAWKKTTKSGEPWLSLAVKPKEEKKPAPKQRQREPGDDDEDLPFVTNSCMFAEDSKLARRLLRHGRQTVLHRDE